MDADPSVQPLVQWCHLFIKASLVQFKDSKVLHRFNVFDVFHLHRVPLAEASQLLDIGQMLKITVIGEQIRGVEKEVALEAIKVRMKAGEGIVDQGDNP